MDLELRPDADRVASRWEAFWRGESPRPLIYAVGPREGVPPVPPPAQYSFAFGDADRLMEQALAAAACRDYYADAIPFFQVSLAADHFAALLGAEIRHHPDSPETMWIEPFVDDWDAVELAFDRQGRWWERTVEVIRTARRHGDGRLLVVGPNLQGGLDALSAIRGPQQLVMDLVDRPDQVRRALARVDRAEDEVRQALAAELDQPRFGSMNRFGMYCRGALDIPQCDFSCMIGPAMFAEFEMPSLRHEINGLDASIYHLDGPGALQHLDAICSIDRLGLIQWQMGAGNYDKDWSAVYRRIDELGKGQFRWFSGEAQLDSIRRDWAELRSRLQFYALGGLTRPQVDRLLATWP